MEKKEEDQEFLPGFSTVDDFVKNGFQVVSEAIKASNALPSQREWDFYKTYDSFNKILNNESDKVLRLMNKILHSQQQNVNIRNRDLDEKMEMLIEANDNILERVALYIDELNGIKKAAPGPIEIQAVSAQLPVNGSWNQLNKAKISVSSSIENLKNSENSYNSIRLLTAKNIIRPQTFFKDKIDNSNNPWIPRITEKPNSIKPLAIFLEESEFGEIYSHPYETELEHFTPRPEQLQKVIPVTVKKLEETPLVEVSTPEELYKLVDELRECNEFAIDLEHHSYRTFMGITCLMQISTKNTDYLIDTFTLRDKLCILNEVFTKPSIVKILHGADHDIEWLQRDLSLYIVNMFDTHQAAKQLGYSGLSLAYLLNKFCNIALNKHFQLADWRIRPLPDELKTYARMDTHYLIHIYHVLKNELLKKGNGSDNILKSVIHQSTEICKKRYVKPILTENSHLEFYQKCKRLFDNRQMYALKELYKWRDNLARTEDESTGYILPNHMLLQISEQIPREMQGILACCNPIPPLVRANLLELHRIILKAREQPSVKPILKEDNRGRGSTIQLTIANVDGPLHCPHDLSKSSEFRDDLPTLLGSLENHKFENNRFKQCLSIENTKSRYSVFNSLDKPEEKENEAVLKIRNVSFLAPFERYELIKPYIQAEEEKDASENDNNSKEISNDDRIAALHEHFVKVSKENPQKPPEEREIEEEVKETIPIDNSAAKTLENIPFQATLKSMCTSRKRKRNQDDYEDDYDSSNLNFSNNQMEHMHTPIPNWKKAHVNHKKNKNKNFNNKNRGSNNFKKNQTPNHNDSKPGGSGANRNKQGFQQRQNKKFKDKQNFKPFDYSSVNFQQFQGGASKPDNKKGTFRTQFKAKNKRKKNNKNFNNKSMTYNRQH